MADSGTVRDMVAMGACGEFVIEGGYGDMCRPRGNLSEEDRPRLELEGLTLEIGVVNSTTSMDGAGERLKNERCWCACRCVSTRLLVTNTVSSSLYDPEGDTPRGVGDTLRDLGAAPAARCVAARCS